MYHKLLSIWIILTWWFIFYIVYITSSTQTSKISGLNLELETSQYIYQIPVHKLGVVLGIQLCKVILKSHVLTGCDLTRKVGTKAAALNSEPEQYLESFGEIYEPSLESFKKAEKYLVRVLLKNSKSQISMSWGMNFYNKIHIRS